MYLFFHNVLSNPTAEMLKLKLQSPSYPGAARTESLKPALSLPENVMRCPVVYTVHTLYLVLYEEAV